MRVTLKQFTDELQTIHCCYLSCKTQVLIRIHKGKICAETNNRCFGLTEECFDLLGNNCSANSYNTIRLKIFVAEQKLDAKHIAKAYDMEYFLAASRSDLDEQLEAFFGESTNGKPKVMEINTMNENNSGVLETYFKAFQKRV